MEGLLKMAVEKGTVGNDTSPLAQNAAYSTMEVDANEHNDSVQEVCMSLIAPNSLMAPDSRGADMPVTSLSLSPRFQEMAQTKKQSETMIWEPVLTRQPFTSSTAWKGSPVRDLFSRRVFRELPPKSLALVLIEEAFASGHSTFPIFDQRSFTQHFQDHYSQSNPSDPGWWACINIVLALGHRFRAMRTLEAQHENEQSCHYLQNALAVVSELTMLHNNLQAIQALLGMTIVLEGTPNPRLSSVLNAAALRLAQTMGLHRKNVDPSLTAAEIEERKNVFWIAYFLDRDISLRTGQPPLQDDDDMDVDLPCGTISDLPLAMLREMSWILSIFSMLVSD